MKRFLTIFVLLSLAAASLCAQRNYYRQNDLTMRKSGLSDTLDALKYEIHLNSLNFSTKTIEAKTIITLQSKVNNLQTVTLELINFTVDQVFVNGFINPDFQHQGGLLSVQLAAPVPAGEIVAVEVHYHGVPFHEGWGGFHWSGQYAFNLGVGFESDPHNLGKAWFPCIDDFHDRAVYEIFTTVSYPKIAVCGGTLMEVIGNGNGTRTYHWKINDDIPTYLASVAVGEYINKPSSFTSITGEEIPIGIYVRPSDTAKVNGTFQTLVPILGAFEQYFGPYRWERVGYVGTALGAMEHSTNIAFPNSSITGNLSSEWLIAHEISHQWFGDLVTCASAEDMWLNEGWAVFTESLYREALYGIAAYRSNMFTKHRTVLHTAHVTDGGYRALYGIPAQYTYGTTVYQKGGIVVHTLRNYMGDNLFFPAVRAFLDEYAFNHADSWQLRDILTSHSGMDLTDFFDVWVFTPGFPEFSVDSFDVQPSGNQYNVTVFTRQKLKGPCQLANSNRVEITFMNNLWQLETVLMEFSGETGQQTFTVNINPSIAMMDFYDKIADATTDKHLTLTASTNLNLFDVFAKLRVDTMPATDSGFIRITHRWVPPDPLKTAIEGLTLSDYRHWRVDGIFPEGTSITGSFMYNKFNNLDGNLMANPGDSLVILYRPNPVDDWQSVDFVKIGAPNTGYIEVANMQPGDYTLAVWDQVYVKVPEAIISQTDDILIFPNPVQGMVSFEFGEFIPTLINVYSESGGMIQQIFNPQAEMQVEWDTTGIKRGTYILRFINEYSSDVRTRKIVVN